MAPDTVGSCLSAVACYAGFVLLALGQERHWGDVMGTGIDQRAPRAWMVAAATALLGGALWIEIALQGLGFGLLSWAMTLCAAAIATGFTLAWRPTLLRPLARCLRGPAGAR